MISLFRNFFQSKIGLPIFIGFLILVGFAFAMADVSGSSTFGGLSGDDKVAVVGGEDITSNEMNDLIGFLHALTSPSLKDLERNVPRHVPSGLPVD